LNDTWDEADPEEEFKYLHQDGRERDEEPPLVNKCRCCGDVYAKHTERAEAEEQARNTQVELGRREEREEREGEPGSADDASSDAPPALRARKYSDATVKYLEATTTPKLQLFRVKDRELPILGSVLSQRKDTGAPPPVMEGYLVVLSRSKEGAWKRRWCVLDSSMMLFLHDKADHSQLKGQIKVRAATSVANERHGRDHLVDFEATDGMTTTVSAESEDAKQAWLAAVIKTSARFSGMGVVEAEELELREGQQLQSNPMLANKSTEKPENTLSRSTSGLLRSVQKSIVRRKSTVPAAPQPESTPAAADNGHTRAVHSSQRADQNVGKKPLVYSWTPVFVFLVVCVVAELCIKWPTT
jgi:hypothetical protein